MGLATRIHDGSAYSPAVPYKSQEWYAAYMAALFESDRALIAERIANAERMVLTREHELLKRETDALEKHALNSALHALRALRTCLGLSGNL